MRRALALLLLTATPAACGSATHTTDASTIVRPPPSGFVVEGRISDPLCNGGRGIRLAARLGDDPVFASGTLADGSTLIALSPLYPAKSFAFLQSVTRRCAPNHAFGSGGTVRISVPSRLSPARRRGGPVRDGLWIDVVAPRNGGGAIVAGTYAGKWVVGEVTRRGRMDPTFGDGGWAVLPFDGAVAAVVQERSGRIVIAGDNGGGGCCTENWAAALSARGHLEHGFGLDGRAELPTGTDSGVAALALTPNGEILVQVAYGNNGCWGDALAMLTPRGRPVPLFAKRLARFWHRLRFGTFVGDAYVDGNGFTLVGVGERPCYGFAGPSHPAPPATGLITPFRTSGEPFGRTGRFRSHMDGSVYAFHDGDDTFVAEVPYADETRLTVTAHRRDGSLDRRFGNRGRVRIRTPWRDRDAALETHVAILDAGPRAIVVVAMRSSRKQLQVIRLRL